MKVSLTSYSKAFKPTMIRKAIQSFDKATIVIVSACWGGAVLVMLFALYTINLSVTAKRQAIEAAATEPSLPRLVTRAPEASEMKPIVDRMQKRFPDITFALGGEQSLTITALDGSRFRTWLTVLSYIDTISPQYRWQIKELCVGGACPSSTPMRAVLQAQKISFSAPSAPIK